MHLTVDDNTVASNPGEITISPDKYIAYYRFTGWKRTALRLLTKLPNKVSRELFPHWRLVHDWIERYEQFRFGCINPCVVVDSQNGTVAAFTSLTARGNRATPVIKIYHERLDLVRSISISNGQRLASVALYARDPDYPKSPNWKDFFPLVPNCFTDDLESCQAALSSISKEAWTCLEEGLRQIDNKNNPGLYYLKLDNALVQSAY